MNAQEHVERGINLLKNSKISEAVGQFTEAIRLGGDSLANTWRSVCFAQLQEWNAAIVDATNAIARDPQDADAYLIRGESHLELGNYDSAISDLTNATMSEDSRKRAKALAGRGAANRLKGQFEQAKLDCTHAISLFPTSCHAYIIRGLTHIDLDATGDAIIDFTAGIKTGDLSGLAFTCRATGYYEDQQYENAVRDCDQALELGHSVSDVYVTRGLSFGKLNDHRRAIMDLSHAIALDPDDCTSYLHRANAYFDNREYAKAVDDATHAIRLAPSYAMAFVIRATAYAELGNETSALEDCERAVQLDEGESDAYLVRGRILRRQGEFALALADFQTALAINPESATILSNLSWLLCTCPNGKFRRNRLALELATKACTITDYADANCLDALAAAHANAGDFDAACRWLSIATALFVDRNDREEIEDRLNLYKSGKPFRESCGIKSSRPEESGTWRTLLAKCLGDSQKAQRLVAYEHLSDSSIGVAEAISRAIYKYDRDNR